MGAAVCRAHVFSCAHSAGNDRSGTENPKIPLLSPGHYSILRANRFRTRFCARGLYAYGRRAFPLDTPYAIEMLHITKRFPGIVANDDITLQLRKGEIHALLERDVIILSLIHI